VIALRNSFENEIIDDMPLLKSNKDSTQTRNTGDNNTRSSSSSPGRKRSIFSGRRRTSSSGGSGHGSSGHDDSGHRTSGTRRTSGHRTFGSGIFGRGRDKHLLDNDQSIITARQGVSDAETAEREADKALVEARNRVKFAHEHVRNLEQEAIEE
jgi:hypothetical protein